MPPLDFLQYFHWHYATDYDKRLIEEHKKMESLIGPLHFYLPYFFVSKISYEGYFIIYLQVSFFFFLEIFHVPLHLEGL
jgi:hypothetical protein